MKWYSAGRSWICCHLRGERSTGTRPRPGAMISWPVQSGVDRQVWSAQSSQPDRDSLVYGNRSRGSMEGNRGKFGMMKMQRHWCRFVILGVLVALGWALFIKLDSWRTKGILLEAQE